MYALTDPTRTATWNPGSWRSRPAAQQPPWPDPDAERAVLDELARLPGLVTPPEITDLRCRLAEAAAGRAFVLQAGDCAERFADCTEAAVTAKVRLILQMALVLGHGAGLPIVPVGRIAGQYGKPRSSPSEVVHGVELPVFRGDVVNDPAPTAAAREPDPRRMRRAYDHAAVTRTALDAVLRSPVTEPADLHRGTCDMLRAAPAGREHRAVAAEITRALLFRETLGAPPQPARLFTSHEALLPAFEQALVRRDPCTGGWTGASAHQLWVGERTRDPDGAHVELLSGLDNPVAVKIGPTATPEDVRLLCERLDPHRTPGRLTLISRMGADVVAERLLPLVEAVADDGRRPVWLCDPMHGNTVRSATGLKTRRFDDIVREIEGFFAVHRLLGTAAGGLHLELTGDDVTECSGGAGGPSESDLGRRYETACDPRMNSSQSLELAFRVAALFHDRRSPVPTGAATTSGDPATAPPTAPSCAPAPSSVPAPTEKEKR